MPHDRRDKVITLSKLQPGMALPGAVGGLSLPQAAQIAAETPDETWYAADDQGRTMGCVSLWWRRPAVYRGQRTGVFGHFSSAGCTVSDALLRHALERLHREGCELAAGPINGSTWYSYRLITDRCSGPDFPMDVQTPLQWCGDFRAAGLSELETYCSVSLGPPSEVELDFGEHAAPVARKGIRVRTADFRKQDRDLHAVWSLSMQCFSENPFFMPIEAADFLALYRPLAGLMSPEYVLLAEDEEGLCGFHFAFPFDLPGRRRGVVSKSMAVHPRVGGAGLGSHLMRRMLARAAADRAAEFILAFMHDGNLSARWAQAHGRVIRRYAVFGKPLA